MIMISVRRAQDRGHFDHGWLNTYHMFSFADYYDPAYEGFRTLRVINEDRVEPGRGFGMHGHRDMEIVTCVLEGALEHRDSLGNGSVLRPGELQRMTAGTGIRHSEFNPSPTEPVHFYQIWLLPERPGLQPGYEQRRFADADKHNRLRLVASPDGRQDSLTIRQDTDLYLTAMDHGAEVSHEFDAGRHGWLQVLRCRVQANGTALTEGDGAAISKEQNLKITAASDSEILLFDLS
jgi:redox-sensitive bicupin YhaK (pirin superfamily)